jgi:hypothetical protein
MDVEPVNIPIRLLDIWITTDAEVVGVKGTACTAYAFGIVVGSVPPIILSATSDVESNYALAYWHRCFLR